MKNVMMRVYDVQMGMQFHDWALTFFSPEGGNVNQMIIRSEAINDFLEVSKVKNYTTQKFSTAITAFCQKYGYTLNPKAYRNKEGRIIRRQNDEKSGKSKIFEMIYVQTTKEIDVSELNQQEYEGVETPF